MTNSSISTLARAALVALAGLFTTAPHSIAATAIFEGYPAPGGNSYSASGPGPIFGVQSRTYSGFNPSAFSQLWWGPQVGLAMDGAIDSAGETLTVSSGLGTSTLVLTGTTSITTSTVYTRFTATITGGAGVWIDPTTVGVAPGTIPALAELLATVPFTVNVSAEASFVDGLFYSPFIPFFDNNSANPQDGNAISSIGGDFYYAPATVPLPAALPLAAAGFGIMALMGWRRRRA